MEKMGRARRMLATLAAMCMMAMSLCVMATPALADDGADASQSVSAVSAADASRVLNNLRWSVTGSTTATASWDPVTGATYYTFWILKNGVHTQTEQLQSPEYDFRVTEPGSYRFAVGAAQGAGGASSALTNSRDELDTVTVNPNNGQAPTPVGMLVIKGHRLDAEPSTPSWGSNMFVGWTLDPKDRELSDNYEFNGWGPQIETPITLTAQWMLAPVRSVAWNRDHTAVSWDGDEGASAYEVRMTSNSWETLLKTTVSPETRSIEVPTPTKPGSYKVMVTALGGLGVVDSPGVMTPLLHSVTFDAAGGTGAPAMEFVENRQVVVPPADPVREGYRFDGWYRANGSTPYTFGSPVTGPVDLVAHWSLAPCAVQLHLNGGVLEGEDVTSYNPGTPQVLPLASHIGCTFGGWYDNEQLEGSPVTEIGADATGDREYWAKWDPLVYKVELDTAGGTIMDRDVTQYAYGTGLMLPQMVVRPGYEFEGWYTLPVLGDQVESIPEDAVGNKVYYAHWRPAAVAPGDTTVPDDPATPDEPADTPQDPSNPDDPGPGDGDGSDEPGYPANPDDSADRVPDNQAPDDSTDAGSGSGSGDTPADQVSGADGGGEHASGSGDDATSDWQASREEAATKVEGQMATTGEPGGMDLLGLGVLVLIAVAATAVVGVSRHMHA